MITVYLNHNTYDFVFTYPEKIFTELTKNEKYAPYQRMKFGRGQLVIHKYETELFHKVFDYLETFDPVLQRKINVYIPLSSLFTKKSFGFFMETYVINAHCGLKFHDSLNEDYYFQFKDGRQECLTYPEFVKRVFEKCTREKPEKDIVFSIFFNVPDPSKHFMLGFLKKRNCFINIQKPSSIRYNGYQIFRLIR